MAAILLVLASGCGARPAETAPAAPPSVPVAAEAREQDSDRSIDAAEQFAREMREHPDYFSVDPEAWSAVHGGTPPALVRGPDPETGIALVSMTVHGRTRTATREVLVVDVLRAIYGMLSPRGQGEWLVLGTDGVVIAELSHVAFNGPVEVDSDGRLRVPGVPPVMVTDEGLVGSVRLLDYCGVPRTVVNGTDGCARPDRDTTPSDAVAMDLVGRLPKFRNSGPGSVPAVGLRFLGWVGDLGVVDAERDVLVIDREGTLVATADETQGLCVRLDSEGRLCVGEEPPVRITREGFATRGPHVLDPVYRHPDPSCRWTPE